MLRLRGISQLPGDVPQQLDADPAHAWIVPSQWVQIGRTPN